MKTYCLGLGVLILLFSQTSCVSTLLGEMSSAENKWSQLWQPQNTIVGGNKPKNLKKKSTISVEIPDFKASKPVFYRRVPNKMIIKAKDASDDDLEITVSSGMVSLVAPNEYAYFAQGSAEIVDFSIRNKKTQEFWGKTYVVQDPPPPTVFVGNTAKDVWTAAEFRQQTKLGSSYDHDLGTDKKIKCDCTSFHLIYAPLGGQREDIDNNGKNFSPETLELIRKAKKGDIYMFDLIKNNCALNEVLRVVYTIR